MRRPLANLLVVLLLTVMVWGYVGELFDHWDRTMQTGNDVELNLVLVAVCVGATVVGLKLFRPSFLLVARCGNDFSAPSGPPARNPGFSWGASLTSLSPPSPLRI